MWPDYTYPLIVVTINDARSETRYFYWSVDFTCDMRRFIDILIYYYYYYLYCIDGRRIKVCTVLHIIIVIDVDSRSCSENKLLIKYTYSYVCTNFAKQFFYVSYICMPTLYSRKRQITMSIPPFEDKQQNKQ